MNGKSHRPASTISSVLTIFFHLYPLQDIILIYLFNLNLVMFLENTMASSLKYKIKYITYIEIYNTITTPMIFP